MRYTVNNYHVFKAEFLSKWMTKISDSQFATFIYHIHDGKLWNITRWQEPAIDKASDLRVIHFDLIVMWNTPASTLGKY